MIFIILQKNIYSLHYNRSICIVQIKIIFTDLSKSEFIAILPVLIVSFNEFP